MSYDISIFMPEIELITIQLIRKAIIDCLVAAPKYFWTVPASITGKYHPLFSLGEGGLIRHTKTAMAIGANLARYDVTTENRVNNIIVPALILHDIAKYGLGDEPITLEEDPSRYAYLNHHRIGADFCMKVWYAQIGMNEAYYDALSTWTEITQCILKHTGRWGVMPQTKTEWVVHFADMASSTRIDEKLYLANTQEIK